MSLLCEGVLRWSRMASWTSDFVSMAFRSTFLAVFTAHSACPLLWLLPGLDGVCSKSHSLENVANSTEAY